MNAESSVQRRLQPPDGRGRCRDGARHQGTSGRDPPTDKPLWRSPHRHRRRRHPGRVSERYQRCRMCGRAPDRHGCAQRRHPGESPHALPHWDQYRGRDL